LLNDNKTITHQTLTLTHNVAGHCRCRRYSSMGSCAGAALSDMKYLLVVEVFFVKVMLMMSNLQMMLKENVVWEGG